MFMGTLKLDIPINMFKVFYLEYLNYIRKHQNKKALKCKIRTFDHTYEHGDYVYYKRDRSDGWEGPARVVYQDNKVILVRHGRFFYKVSANRIQPAHKDLVKEFRQQDLIDFDTSIFTLVEYTSFIYINYFGMIMYKFQRNKFTVK